MRCPRGVTFVIAIADILFEYSYYLFVMVEVAAEDHEGGVVVDYCPYER